jgi:hypothetical protein
VAAQVVILALLEELVLLDKEMMAAQVAPMELHIQLPAAVAAQVQLEQMQVQRLPAMVVMVYLLVLQAHRLHALAAVAAVE